VFDDNNRRENLRRRYRDYQVGDEVLLFTQNPATLQERSTGPFIVEQVNTNGTLTVQRAPNVFDHMNICHLRPYTTAFGHTQNYFIIRHFAATSESDLYHSKYTYWISRAHF
jgi:hypothetical protein